MSSVQLVHFLHDSFRKKDFSLKIDKPLAGTSFSSFNFTSKFCRIFLQYFSYNIDNYYHEKDQESGGN